MRVAARGGFAAQRPRSGMQRLADRLGDALGARDAVSFAPVDGVFQAESATERRRRPLNRRPIRQAGAPARLYDRRARETLVYVAPVGQQLSVRA